MALDKKALALVPVLQYRWNLNSRGNAHNLVYSGIAQLLSQKGNIMISREAAAVIAAFDGTKNLESILAAVVQEADLPGISTALHDLLDKGVVVDIKDRESPAAFADRQTCTKCVNDNYVIPDLQFDENGVCTFCRNYEKHKDQMADDEKSITDSEILAYIRDNPSRHDALVLYTGGKDSSYLLWYLSKKLGLRILAATWNMPFMQETARTNMRSAMRRLPNVEFIERTVRWDEMKEALRLNFIYNGLPCLCPFMAYLLFYPVAVSEGIPLIIDGIEKVQMLVNKSQFAGVSQNITTDQLDRENTVAELTLKVVRYMKKLQKPAAKNSKPLTFFRDFEKIIPYINDPGSRLPVIKHLANTHFYSTWDEMVEVIKKELDWKMPEGQDSCLHTSCSIEAVKDYCQYRMYNKAVSPEIPQSITEISGAVSLGFIKRENGLKELADRGYYAEPDCIRDVVQLLDISEAEKFADEGKLKYIFGKD